MQTKGLRGTVRAFKARHPDFYEFIMFNLWSNAATITNFVVLWFSTGLIFKALAATPFHWFIFDYPVKSGGLGGFYSFLLAYVAAQIVNYFVQRYIVFGAHNNIADSLPWYIGTVVFAGLVSVWLPPHVIAWLAPYIGGFAATVANVINIVLQVVINYPMLKFKVMKKE
ncbi:GtrA family protein [Lacticaseibacillus daqingensis]|uniref:GtrA family protein n=1 Tax=Lacticaseibacillus daqingensis TaxID=2486014 RepID=UPI000F7ACF36|nr:GtrA family protein [Lacticaseibacillus daqingensis]